MLQRRGTPVVSDGTGLAEALLGLDGFGVLEVTETDSEVVIRVETIVEFVAVRSVGCGPSPRIGWRWRCAIWRASGGLLGLVWLKRRWRWRDADCTAKTWTETCEHVSARCVLTCRAGAEACRWAGQDARPVAGVAREVGVCWWTVMAAVIEHGEPLVNDPGRVGEVHSLGVDETSLLKATRQHPTIYATGLVDLDARILIDIPYAP
jgi:transposase